MKTTNKLDVWMISRLSAFLGEQICSQTDTLVDWVIETRGGSSTVVLDFEKKELGFVDWMGDDKTYYALCGVAMTAGFTSEDYYTTKN